MIPLRLKAEFAHDVPSFVVRLDASEAPIVSLNDAAFRAVADGWTLYETFQGPLRIFGLDPIEANQDVILVHPKRGAVHRLIRAKSRHNTLLITEQCDQLCVMCSQPPKPHHFDQFDFFENALVLAPRDSWIGLSGGEPLLYKRQVFNLVASSLAGRPDLSFHVLTNGQHFENSDAGALHANRVTVLWGIPLYAASATLHDRIVAKAGAHARLMKSFEILARAGSAIELRTVVTGWNVCDLPKLSQFIAAHLPFINKWAIMQIENIGYARKNWDSLFFDTSADFGSISHAADLARARGIEVQLYNFPRCTIPQRYRHLAPSTISDWKRFYPEACEKCPEQQLCGGFFGWRPGQLGFQRIGL